VGCEIEKITLHIASVHAQSVTIVLVEHVQADIQPLADRLIVLEWDRKIAEGTPQEIAEHPEVIAVSCPYCMTMLGDGIKAKELEEKVQTLDVMEIVDEVTRSRDAES